MYKDTIKKGISSDECYKRITRKQVIKHKLWFENFVSNA